MAKKSTTSMLLQGYGVDEASRTLYLSDLSENETEGTRSEVFIKCLKMLDDLAPNGDKEINVIMNHSGGSVFDGMAIYDAIASTKNAVIVTVMGGAMSMGAIILQAADVRILAPHSIVMIHHGQNGIEEHKKTVQNWIDFHKKEYDSKLDDILFNKIREKKPRFKRKDLEKMLDFDTIFTAERAIEYGLADCMLGDSDLDLLGD